uniref:Uncharacterized protein n=1 Tax=Anguilla anguilla TaxID=7936 RepID=A0A0E9W0Y8_ANGAN
MNSVWQSLLNYWCSASLHGPGPAGVTSVEL